MSNPNNKYIILIGSALIFFLLTTIPPKVKDTGRRDSTVTKDPLSAALNNIAREDGATKSASGFASKNNDSEDETAESNIDDHDDPRFFEETSSSIQRLIEIAEKGIEDNQINPTGEHKLTPVQPSTDDIFKCLPQKKRGTVSGDRLAFDLPVSQGVVVTYSIEEVALCEDPLMASVIAQFFLGHIYQEGRGVPLNYQEALNWYRRAANNGFSHANFHLGKMFYNGDGVAQDYEEAARHYRRAADQGLAAAQKRLGDMYLNGETLGQSFTEAVKWYRKAAEQGDSSAQTRLGQMFFWGEGVDQSFPKALAYYRKAADQGNIEAMAQVGHIYEHGLGTGENQKKAQCLYLAVAQQADANSLLLLGVDWETEPIQLNSNVMAYLWYSLSAHKGLKYARQNRSFVKRKMTVAQIIIAERKSQYFIKKMANNG